MPDSYHGQSVFPTEETHHPANRPGDLTPEDHQEAADGPKNRREGEQRLRPNIEQSEIQQVQSHDYLEPSAKDAEGERRNPTREASATRLRLDRPTNVTGHLAICKWHTRERPESRPAHALPRVCPARFTALVLRWRYMFGTMRSNPQGRQPASAKFHAANKPKRDRVAARADRNRSPEIGQSQEG